MLLSAPAGAKLLDRSGRAERAEQSSPQPWSQHGRHTALVSPHSSRRLCGNTMPNCCVSTTALARGELRCCTAAASPPSRECTEVEYCNPEQEGSVLVRDDLESLIQVLPEGLRGALLTHPNRNDLLEVILDLGRRPHARYLGGHGGEDLREEVVTQADLEAAEATVGAFGGDNRAGVEGTLHRISAIRNRDGKVVGLTCRVGRAVVGHLDMIRDLMHVPNSILFLGRPGVGKTTVIREMARVLADDLKKRVVIVDTSNEIGGDGDVPHPAIGTARRMQVADPSQQHRVMIEAVENHMPEVVIVDEIGTNEEALACRSIAERGVQLVGTAHGQVLENLLKNPAMTDLIGGIQTVTLGDDEARLRGTQKTVLERVGPPTFPIVIEMRTRAMWVTHWVQESVDALLNGKLPNVEVRSRHPETCKVVVESRLYDPVTDGAPAPPQRAGPPATRNDGAFLDYEVPAGMARSMPSMASISNMARSAEEAAFSWADRLRQIPDKEMYLSDDGETTLGTLQARYSERTVFPGAKRGSKRRHGKVNSQ